MPSMPTLRPIHWRVVFTNSSEASTAIRIANMAAAGLTPASAPSLKACSEFCHLLQNNIEIVQLSIILLPSDPSAVYF